MQKVKTSDQIERQADELAFKILMPEEAFRAAWILFPTVAEIAEYFQVPKSAVNVRAMQLKLGYEIHE